MAEELKELIEKINEEGVRQAEEKAAQIENEAKAKARSILEGARKETKDLIAQAQEKIKRMEEASKVSLKQASRDVILTLRKEINALLDRLIASRVHKALSSEEIAKIIVTLVKEASPEKRADIVIKLSEDDIEKLEKGLFAELANETKKGVSLKPSEDIHGGLLISYDSGRSYYDFTDKAVAEYIATALRPKLAEIINPSTKAQG